MTSHNTSAFDHDYVIKITLEHMKNSISISIQKTISRIPEFEDNAEKSEELKRTLLSLSNLNYLINQIEINNGELLNETSSRKSS